MKTVAFVPSTVGYHWEEVYDAYREYKSGGWNIEFYTVDGKQPKPDPKSLENKPLMSLFGLGLNSSFSPDTALGQELVQKLNSDIKPVSELNPSRIDAIYIPGGHGCVFDVNQNQMLHKRLQEAYNEKKVLSAVCHGTSAFSFVTDSKGTPITSNKKLTGFPDLLDKILIKLNWVYDKYVPLPFYNEQKMKSAQAKVSPFNFITSLINPKHMVVDLPFVTGIGPKAAENVARRVMQITR